ncbi:MAG: hypothetical protein AB1Z98_27820 [Nannocystaceae bacterium]
MSACQAADEDPSQARVGYTTNTTLGDDDPCDNGTASFDINPRRSLFETNPDALAHLGMAPVLQAIVASSARPTSAAELHDRLMDTHDEAPGLGLIEGQHCDDALAFNGTPGLNGYPLECPRAEANLVGDMAGWFPIAAVNRFDLAPSDGANCGEARLVMANNTLGRAFVIFEAVIPNPDPDCGIEACMPVQEFWASLTNLDAPAARAEQLQQAYIDGHPTLLAAGFGPFMSFANFEIGTARGQIRTNTFVQNPWALREFKLERSPEGSYTPWLRPTPVPVASNAFGPLWNDAFSGVPVAASCRQDLVTSVPSLMGDDPNLLALQVSDACLAAESANHVIANNYPFFLAQGSGTLQASLQAAMLAHDPTTPLTVFDLAQRARFAGTCIGCHEETNGFDLGDGLIAPSSAGFVHTNEQIMEPCGDGASCFAISDAVEHSFLPFREQVMEEFLSQLGCCSDEGAGPCCETFVPGQPEPPPTPPIPCDFPFGYCVDTDPLCVPLFEDGCDPTSESCQPSFDGCAMVQGCEPFCPPPAPEVGPQPPEGCDPATENCPEPPPGCDPATENCPDPTVEMSVGRPRGLTMGTSDAQPPSLDELDVQRFMAMERELRAQQSPWTISGRPNVRGH